MKNKMNVNNHQDIIKTIKKSLIILCIIYEYFYQMEYLFHKHHTYHLILFEKSKALNIENAFHH